MTFLTVPDAVYTLSVCSLINDEHSQTNVTPRRCTRVNGNNDTSLEPKCKRSSTVFNLYSTRWVCVIVCVKTKEGSGLLFISVTLFKTRNYF